MYVVRKLVQKFFIVKLLLIKDVNMCERMEIAEIL